MQKGTNPQHNMKRHLSGGKRTLTAIKTISWHRCVVELEGKTSRIQLQGMPSYPRGKNDIYYSFSKEVFM